MDVKNLVMAVVGMVLAAVMIGGALLPAVASAIDTQQEKVNNNSLFYRNMTEEDIIFISDVSETGFTMNGEALDIPSGWGSQQIITSDALVFSMDATKNSHVVHVLINGVAYQYNATLLNLTLSEDKIVGTITTETETINIDVPINWCFAYSNDKTDWVLYKAYDTSTIAINNVNQLYSANWISTTSEFFAFHGRDLKVNGVANNSLILNPILQDGYKDYSKILYSGTSTDCSFVVDNNGTDYTVHPYYIIAPKSISVVSESNALIVAMFEVLPIIVIAGLVMAGIYVFISRK